MEVASYSATERNFVMSLVVDMGVVTIDDTWLTDVVREVTTPQFCSQSNIEWGLSVSPRRLEQLTYTARPLGCS